MFDAEQCIDDRYDAGAGDDDFATGRRVRGEDDVAFEGDLTGRLCPDDADYICFWLNNREIFQAHVTVVTGNPTVIGELVDERDEAIGQGQWSREASEDIELQAARGTFCLRLRTEELGGSYSVELNAYDSDVRDLCDGAESLSLEAGTGSVVALLDRRADSALEAACAPGADASELIYK